MKIYTSYFSCPGIDHSRMHLVKISNSVPKGFIPDGVILAAIPDWKSIVSLYKDGQISTEEYRLRYIRQLDARKFALLAQLTEEIKKAGSKQIVLLCYEKQDNFCHRHILAEYIRQNAEAFRLEIEELMPRQSTLFEA